MSQPAIDRRTEAGEQTIRRVLDAAEERFAGEGFRGTSLRDIARDAGIRAPSLYNHFENKEALYGAVLARAFGPMLEILERFLARGPEAYETPGMATDMLAVLAARPNRARLLLHEALSGNRHMNELLATWIERLFGSGLRAMRNSPGRHPWTKEELPLLLLAMNNVIAGYVAVAPAFEGTLVRDPLSPAALRRQERFLAKLWTLLWEESPERRDSPERGRGAN